MRKLVLLTVALLSINLAYSQEDKEDLPFLEFILNQSTETKLTSSLEDYTFEKGNAEFGQIMRIVKDEGCCLTSVRLSKSFLKEEVIYDSNGLDTVAFDTIQVDIDPVLLSFPYPVTQEEAFNSTHRIDTTYVDGRTRNEIILDTVFAFYNVGVNFEEYMRLSYLKHTADTLYLEVDFNWRAFEGTYSAINSTFLRDFRPLFNLNCSFRNMLFEDLIWHIKDYSGEEIVAFDDELLTIKLKDDLLYFNIDAAKSITDSYDFVRVYEYWTGDEVYNMITDYQEKWLPDLPKDVAVKLIPSSTIKNLKPIEYAFDIEPIKKFLEEKSW